MKRALVLLVATVMIYGGGTSAQPASGLTTNFTQEFASPKLITFYGEAGRVIATIDLKTGALTFGAGMSADEAARETWRVLIRAYSIGLGDIRAETCAKLLMRPP